MAPAMAAAPSRCLALWRPVRPRTEAPGGTDGSGSQAVAEVGGYPPPGGAGPVLLEGESVGILPETPLVATVPASGTGSLDRAIDLARECLLSLQQPDGHWVGELEGDSILESEYLLLLQFMGWTDPVRFRRAANYLRARQLPT